MLQPRNIIMTLGVLLLLGGGWWSWRASQPVLTDDQQIAANLESLRQAIQNRSSGRVAGFLADDFRWDGQNKRELESMMSGTFFQWRDVQPNITGLRISVDGAQATARGNFSLAYRPRGQSPQSRLGSFQLFLEKRDGNWLITRAEGSEQQ